jgi:ComF family protein
MLLLKDEHYLCLSCEQKFAYHTPSEELSQDLKQRLMGKVNVVHAWVALKFVKTGWVQNFIYEIKYSGQKYAAQWFGVQYGHAIPLPIAHNYVMMAVPLHLKKLVKRGYNQSEYFARGLAQSMNVPLNTVSLIRVAQRTSQTNKKRFQRWQNAEDIYVVKSGSDVVGKHVILVDDVITTGATIESCANVLLAAGAKDISVIAIAIAV